MSRVPSIPSTHEQKVVNWWLFGQSPREIAARLLEEHKVDTSYSSVQRLIDRVSQGHSGAAISAVKARLRLETGQIATELADIRTRVLVVAGVSPGSTQVGSVEALRELRCLDLADRVLHRKLKVAGVETKDTYEELELQARAEQASTLAGVRDGLDYWIEPELARAQPVPQTSGSRTPATPRSPEAAEPGSGPRETARSEPSLPLKSQRIESCADDARTPVPVPAMGPPEVAPVPVKEDAEAPASGSEPMDLEASVGQPRTEPLGRPADELVDEQVAAASLFQLPDPYRPLDRAQELRVIIAQARELNREVRALGKPKPTGSPATESAGTPEGDPINQKQDAPAPPDDSARKPAPSVPVPPAVRRRPSSIAEGLQWAREAEAERLRAARPPDPGQGRNAVARPS